MKRYALRRLLPHCAYPKIHTILCVLPFLKLRCNSPTIKFTILKHTIQGFLVYSQSYVTITTI